MSNYTPFSAKLIALVPKDIILRDKKGKLVRPVAQETNKNGTAGAPTKYDPAFIKKAYEYIDFVNKERASNKKVLPTIEAFSMIINVDHDSIINWANKKLKEEDGSKKSNLAYPEFFSAIKKIKDLQKQILIEDGFYMGKNVNAVMAIFLLKASHGMVDNKQNVTDPNAKSLIINMTSYQ